MFFEMHGAYMHTLGISFPVQDVVLGCFGDECAPPPPFVTLFVQQPVRYRYAVK